MIDSAPLFLVAVLLLTTLIAYAYTKLSYKIQRFVPLVLLIYVGTILFANSGILTMTPSIQKVQATTLSNLIPAMIFLMLLQFRIGLFIRLGSKLLIAFFSTTLSLIISFTAVFYLLKSYLFTDANASLAVLAGSWSGGSANMLAVSKAIDLKESALGTVLAVDTLLYGVWFMFLLSMVAVAPWFDRFTKAKQSYVVVEESCPIESNTRLYVRMIFMAIAVAFVVNVIAQMLPHRGFMQAGILSIVLATLLGVIASFSPLKDLQGTQSVANSMLYLIIALIASKADLSFLEHMGSLLVAGSMVLLFHMLIMLASAKLFRLDLFSVAVASLSHIGGVASAPVLAASFHKSLVPVGVAMALVGYLLGTIVGLSIAMLLGVDLV